MGYIPIVSVHDLSDGGLVVALAESALRGGTGCRVALPDDPFVALFSESTARAIVAIRPDAEAAFTELCARHGVPATEIGTVGGTALSITHPGGGFDIELDELRTAYEGTLPEIFDGE
ncbi:hypothetical protein NORO109296_06835 [Nocardiopsis rhodophaea]